jgi:hypothetical protein
MKTISYSTIDKSNWGPGPWQDEPDKVQWLDLATGLPCLIRRSGNQIGSWCGYVGVSRSHPAYSAEYDELDVRVHGGLTFMGPCEPGGDPRDSICHAVEPGEDDDVVWFGFDCGHYQDLSPGLNALKSLRDLMPDGVYRDQAYVTAEVESLATQLAAMVGPELLVSRKTSLLPTSPLAISATSGPDET